MDPVGNLSPLDFGSHWLGLSSCLANVNNFYLTKWKLWNARIWDLIWIQSWVRILILKARSTHSIWSSSLRLYQLNVQRHVFKFHLLISHSCSWALCTVWWLYILCVLTIPGPGSSLALWSPRHITDHLLLCSWLKLTGPNHLPVSKCPSQHPLHRIIHMGRPFPLPDTW